jgi:hypothetical protein
VSASQPVTALLPIMAAVLIAFLIIGLALPVLPLHPASGPWSRCFCGRPHHRQSVRCAVNEADVQCGLLVAKLIERRCTMLGLHTPQQAVLQIVDSATPNETTTEKIERVLRELAA